jgi:rfaE bifunctional protein nucleotidyltransferase chain/domain
MGKNHHSPYLELENKIVSLEQLIPIVQKLKADGKIIVTNNGSYDIVHLGHILGLFEAKQQGDILIVGVNSDFSVRSYKDPSRPINDEYMRARVLAALSCTDYIFLFDDLDPREWLEKIQPHIHTNGAEYGNDCIERNAVESHGGKIHLLSMIEGYKTTNIIEKIKQGI